MQQRKNGYVEEAKNAQRAPGGADAKAKRKQIPLFVLPPCNLHKAHLDFLDDLQELKVHRCGVPSTAAAEVGEIADGGLGQARDVAAEGADVVGGGVAGVEAALGGAGGVVEARSDGALGRSVIAFGAGEHGVCGALVFVGWGHGYLLDGLAGIELENHVSAAAKTQ